jgi:hypothetical protein
MADGFHINRMGAIMMMDFFLKTNQKQKKISPVFVVSGLPRSGTSMLMKILEAGGLESLTDNIRAADMDNPKGYYEFERVKQIETDKTWLPDAKGKVVKIISLLLHHLPTDYAYKIIFSQRNIQEILASQKMMLIRRGEPTDKVSDEELAGIYEKHLDHIKKWLTNRSGFDVLFINYNDILSTPEQFCKQISDFINLQVNVEKMAAVVDTSLYRQRK